MTRSIIGGVIALTLCWAPAFAADLDLGFPKEPEREVKLPGRGTFTGARLYAPEGAGPFPAAVLSHTCGRMRQSMFEWAQRFLAAGHVVLVVDHLGPRGAATNCWPNTRVSVTEYAQDAVAALRHLRSMTIVDGKRIVMMGFSYGGMAGLRASSKSFREKYLGGESFAAIFSFYPWCNQQAGTTHQDFQWNFYDDTTTPLLVLLGAEDDDCDPRSCIDKARENAAKGMPVEYKVFPGATHRFDDSSLADKPFVFQRGGQTITHRYNSESVEAAWRLTLEFLGRHAGGSERR